MAPFVEELKRLDAGVMMATPSQPKGRLVRLRILYAIGNTPMRARVGAYACERTSAQAG